MQCGGKIVGYGGEISRRLRTARHPFPAVGVPGIDLKITDIRVSRPGDFLGGAAARLRGKRMLDWPEACQTSPTSTFLMVMTFFPLTVSSTDPPGLSGSSLTAHFPSLSATVDLRLPPISTLIFSPGSALPQIGTAICAWRIIPSEMIRGSATSARADTEIRRKITVPINLRQVFIGIMIAASTGDVTGHDQHSIIDGNTLGNDCGSDFAMKNQAGFLRTRGVTPAMQAGIAHHVWEIEKLVALVNLAIQLLAQKPFRDASRSGTVSSPG